MSTTVRVDDEVKADLDRLQGLVQAETGERLSQSDLLARLLRFARRRPEVVLRDEASWTPPTKAEMEALFAEVRDEGPATDASRIKQDLYEDDDPHGG
jgi:hypothetical protein